MRCASLVLGECALVEGCIEAASIIVGGRVNGPMTGRTVTLRPGARVDGDIRYEFLLIEKGASFTGTSYPCEAPVAIGIRSPPVQDRQNGGFHRISGAAHRGAGLFHFAVMYTWLKAGTALNAVLSASVGVCAAAFRQSLAAGRFVLAGIVFPLEAFLNSGTGIGPEGPPAFLVQPRKPKRVRRWRLRIASPGLNLLTLASAGLLLIGYYRIPSPVTQYPLHRTLEAPTERELVLLDAYGQPFARRGGCYDTPVGIGEVPRHFIAALLAMEDRRFYRHYGIDPVGVLRAALFNYNAGKVVQGGSTITQQLAKITYLSGEKTVQRKLEEALIVLRLELGLTKNQILERYLSRAYFGEGCFGLRAAARHYFGRAVGDLTVAQSAYLVALLRSPATLAHNRDDLHRRERLVLRAMAEYGAFQDNEIAAIPPAKRLKERPATPGDYYADWIAETIHVPEDGGMKALPVRTSFEPALQRLAGRAVERALRKAGRDRKATQAALVAMRPDGRVLAMVGGADYAASQFNRATQALRQPGSSFKAFVYLAAMRAGGQPGMMVIDEPVTIGDWSPENYSREYRGAVSLQKAFSASINTVAVRLSEAIGRGQVVKAARDLGITTPIVADPSIALGTSEVTLLELTSAYAAFAANAYPVKPWSVVSVGNDSGEFGHPPEEAGRWRLMAGVPMREFLAATVAYGTGRGAQLPIPAYGKTGTSQNYRDAWFIGFAGNIVVGVWVGNDDNSPMTGVTGGNLPARIWRDFMIEAQREDKHFNPRLPGRIAAFRAQPVRSHLDAAEAGHLESVLAGRDRQFATDTDSSSHFGAAMMFGSPPERTEPRRTYRLQYRRSRPVRSWVNSQDGS